MPGPGSYGPGGKWVHDRAKRIMADGDVPKHLAMLSPPSKATKSISPLRNTEHQRAS